MQKKILIVEDDNALRKALVEKFERENFAVLYTDNGEDGFQIAKKEAPDLVLLDIVLPKVNGLQMMHAIRKDGEWGKKLPIILLTNLDADNNITWAVATDEPAYYLTKAEWKIDDVFEKVKETLKD